MNVISVISACKHYDSNDERKVVLQNFNMNVRQGTIYAMMGSSGSGKTTLLSCLVGISSLDKGIIRMFGEPVMTNATKLRIGFMPQESALIDGFTVREMVWFFGKIFGLTSDRIEERFQFLSSLLELPDKDRMIRDCSGGQQRRISFALTLVHEPELLVLDEPTVGVDPLLRSKIWDYLVELTEKKNVTVLLSTHYIEEARQSTHVGIMRNGIMMVEDSPENILEMCETTSLEEAFLRLSQKQEIGVTDFSTSSKYIKVDTEEKPWLPPLKRLRSTLPPKHTNVNILQALLAKHLLAILRHFHVFVVTLLLPMFGCLSLHFAIGRNVEGLALGVVNHEISSLNECFNSSLMTSELQKFECKLHKVSCKFISEFDPQVAELKFYRTYDEAYADAKKGKIVGFIQFDSNFTKSFPLFNDVAISTDFSDSGIIQVFLDQTDLQITSFIQQKLYDTYQRFAESLMVGCRKSKNAGSKPIIFEALFGNLGFDLKTTLVSGFILGSSFTIASFLTSASIISERSDGTWNRVIAAGVKPNHFVLSHLIEGFIVVIFQFLEWSIYTVFFLSTQLSLNAMFLLGLILLLTGISGLCFGLLLSIVTHSVMASLVVSQNFIYPTSFISGVMWPTDGLPVFLRYIGYIFPFSYATTAFRNVLVKNSTICDHHVSMALCVLTAWIVVPTFLCFWIIKRQEDKK